MELSKRMKAVAQMVPAGHIAADVGCDHGFVSIYLIKENICPHVYAADVRPGPLGRARAHIRESGLEEKITPVLSDGLQRVPEETEVCIAAGMGGRLIVRILRDAPQKTAKLFCVVLEPQSEVWLVRRWLSENGFVIVDEDMVFEDGKFYPVIKGRRAGAAALQADGCGSGLPQAGGCGMPFSQAGRCGSVASERDAEITAAEAGIAALREEMRTAGISEEEQRQAFDRFGPVLMAKKSAVLLSYLEHTIEKDNALAAQMPAGKDGREMPERMQARRKELQERAALAERVAKLLKRQ